MEFVYELNGYGAWQLAVNPRAIWIGWLDKYESSMKETQQRPHDGGLQESSIIARI